MNPLKGMFLDERALDVIRSIGKHYIDSAYLSRSPMILPIAHDCCLCGHLDPNIQEENGPLDLYWRIWIGNREMKLDETDADWQHS
jgi:hypothetical protein